MNVFQRLAVPAVVALAVSLGSTSAALAQMSGPLSSAGLVAVKFEWKVVAEVNGTRCDITAQETGKLVQWTCGVNGVEAYYGIMAPVKPGAIPGDTTLNIIHSVPGAQNQGTPFDQIGLSARELTNGDIEVGVHGNLSAQYFILPKFRPSGAPGTGTEGVVGASPASAKSGKKSAQPKKRRWWLLGR